ncbi:hypothetical protein IGS74_16845 [Aureimonas sp. OT7]|uniref:fibronectin type III domain-containing protein n=1 Tax=Aureimonas sp. OT7 TaxID=2816454 RepID=UPI001780DDBC|nr:glycosyl hydrolase family 18 protein [Aureimonas sp. OT7]QOG06192.1 hypothetical protein IGS74_16845 [Aureimonas sp. OT7]
MTDISLTLEDIVNLQQKQSVTLVTASHDELPEGTRLELWRDNVRVRSVIVGDNANSTTFSLSGADWGADGTHAFKVRTIAPGTGVAGAWSASETVLVDTRPPSRPTILSVSGDNKINSSERSADIPVIVSHEAAVSGTTMDILMNGVPVRTVTLQAGARSTTVDLPAALFQEVTTFDISARLIDSAANASPVSAARSVQVIAQTPEGVAMPVLAGDNIVSAAERATVTTVSVQHAGTLGGGKLEIWRDGVLLKSIAIAANATSTAVRFSGADWGSDGSHVFQARVVDSAGNPGDFGGSQTVMVDTAAPLAPTFSAIAGDGFVNAAEAAQGAGFTVEHQAAGAGDKLELYRDRVLIRTIDLDVGSSSTSVTLLTSEWGAEGAHTLRARVVDAGGNIGAWSANASYSADTATPAAPELTVIARDDQVSAAEKAQSTAVVVRHGLAMSGSRVELMRDDVVVKTVTLTAAASSTSISLTGGDWGIDGAHAFKARLIDAAGNEGEWSAVRSVTVASTLPAAPVLGVFADDGMVNAAERIATSTLSVAHETASAGSQLELYRGSTLVRRVSMATASTSTDLQLSGMDWGADGQAAFTARIVDAYGNASEASAVSTVLVDTRSPLAVTLPSITGDNKITLGEKQANVTIAIGHEAASDGSVLQLYRDGALWKTVSPVAGATTSNIVVEPSDWGAPGTLQLKARLVDTAGNEGAWSVEQRVSVAGALPAAVTLATVATDGIVNAEERRSVTLWQVSHEAALPGGVIQLYRDDVLLKSVTASAGSTSTAISMSGAEWGVDGQHQFKARMVDPTGGAGDWSVVSSVRVDTSPPAAVVVPVIAGDDRINAAEKATGVPLVIPHGAAQPGSMLQIYRDGAELRTVALSEASTTTTVTLLAADIGADGIHVFKFRLVDGAGNLGAWSSERRVLVDTVADGAPVIETVAGDDFVNALEKTNVRLITVAHDAAATGTTLSLYRDGVLLKTVTPAYAATSTRIVVGASDWGVDGAHVFTAKLVDAAGNESDLSAARNVTVMTGTPLAPTLPVLGTDAIVNAVEKAASSTVAVTHGAMSEGATLELYRDGVRVKTVQVTAGLTATDLAMSGSDWGSDGFHGFKVRIVDVAGNVSQFSAEQRVSIDTIAPVAAVLTAVGDGNVNATEKQGATIVRISHEAATAGSVVQLWRDGDLVRAVSVSAGVRATAITLTGSDWGSEGEHAFKARLVDGAGNIGAWSGVQVVTVASSAPAAVTWGTLATDSMVNAAEKAAGVDVAIGHDAAETGARLEIYRDDRLVKTVVLVVGATSTTVSLAAGDWGSEGAHAFTARMVDGSGNAGAWSEVRSVLVDSLAPAASSILSIANNGSVGAAELAAASQATVRHDAATAGSKLELYSGDTLFKRIDLTAGATQTTFDIDPSEWGADGVYAFKARVVDAAGNAGAFSFSKTVTVALPTTLSTLSDGVVNGTERMQSTTATVSHAAVGVGWTIELYRDSTLVKTVSVSSGSTSTAIQVTDADWGTEGTHSFSAHLVSPASVIRSTAARQVLVDYTAPDAASLALGVIAGDDTVTAVERQQSADAIVTHAAAETGESLNFYRDGVLVKSVAVAAGSTSTAVSFSESDWGSDGSHAFTVSLVDAAGNVTVQSAARTVTVEPATSLLDISAAAVRDQSALLVWDRYTPAQAGHTVAYRIFNGSTLLGETTDLAYKVEGLTASTDYVLSVKVVEQGVQTNLGEQIAFHTTASGWWDIPQVYSPYIDVGIGPVTYNNHLKVIEQSGLKAVTLGFLILKPEGWIDADHASQVDGTGVPTGNTDGLRWGESNTTIFPSDMITETVSVKAMIAELQSKNIDVTIALGGFSGSEPALYETDVEKLTAIYQSIIDEYGIKHLDIDIEGASLNSLESGGYHGFYPQSYLDQTHLNRIEALKAIKEANPDVSISFTLPVLPSGLLPNAVALMQMVKDEGFGLDVLNIMAMDYGTGDPDQGRNAVEAAQNTIAQLRGLGLATKVGVTPMIGINDVISEVFTLEDARELLEFAKDNPDIASLGIWSLGRDLPSDPGSNGFTQDDVIPNGSAIVDQTHYEFSGIFNQLSNVGAGYNPASGLTVLGVVSGNDMVGTAESTATTQVTANFPAAVAGSQLQVIRDGIVVKTLALTAGATSRDVALSGADWGAEGVHMFSVRVVNGSGATLSTSAPRAVTVDKTAPTAPVVGQQAGDDAVGSQEASNGLAFTFTHAVADAGTKARIFRDGVLVKTVTLATDSTQTQVMLYGSDWGTVGTAATPSYTVQLIDAAGNASAASAGHTVAVSKYATLQNWDAGKNYPYNSTVQGSQPFYVLHDGVVYRTKWYASLGEEPGTISDPSSDPWEVVETLPTNPQPQVGDLRILPTALADTSVMLMWDAHAASSSGAAVTYKIYKGTDLLTTTSNLSYKVTGLTASTAYQFSVHVVENGTETQVAESVSVQTTAYPLWDIAQYYSPYIDMGLGKSQGQLEALTTSNAKHVTLAFLVLKPDGWVDSDTPAAVDANGNPTGVTHGLRWGEGNLSIFPDDKTANGSTTIKALIQQLQGRGIDVTIGLGGFSGSEPALFVTNVQALTAMYQSVLDTYGVKHLDIDIEGASLNSVESGGYHGFYHQAYLDQTHLNRIEALKAIKAANPDVTISYTIPITPDGMLPNAVALMQMVKDHGLDLDVVNIMAMDYGAGDWGHRGDQGRNAIDAARNTIAQLRQIGLDAKVGITPMIGINDVQTEIFTLQDAQELLAFAKDNPDVASLGIWSLGRDETGTPGQLTVGGSGITQDPYGFTTIFEGITDAGAGYDTHSGLTIVNALSSDDIVNAAEKTGGVSFTVNHAAAVANSVVKLYRDGVLIKSVAASAGSNQTTVSISGSDFGSIDGDYTFAASLVSNGVEGTRSVLHHVIVDTVAPTAPVIAAVSSDHKVVGGEGAEGIPVSFSHGAASAGSKLDIYKDGALIRTVTMLAGTTQTSVSLYAADLGLATESNTTIALTAKVRDLAGNIGGTSATESVIVQKYAFVKPWTDAVGAYTSGGLYASYEGQVYKTKWYPSDYTPPSASSEWTLVGPLYSDPAVPNAPTRLYATGISQTGAFVMWDKALIPGTGTVSGYDIFVDGTKVGSATDTQFSLTGLTAAHTYAVTVVAKDETGSSVASTPLSVITRSSPVPDIAQTYTIVADVSRTDTDVTNFIGHSSSMSTSYIHNHVENMSNSIVWAGGNSSLIGVGGQDRWMNYGAAGTGNTTGQGQINEYASSGGKPVILSFARDTSDSTSDLALGYPTSSALLPQLSALTSRYNTDYVDFTFWNSDLSAYATNASKHTVRDLALRDLDNQKNDALHISYTVETSTTGLTAGAFQMLQAAHGTGVKLDVLNILAADYWGSGSGIDMGRTAIDVALDAIQKLDAVGYTDTKVGILVRAGANGGGGTFSIDDAQQIYAFAKENPHISGIGLLNPYQETNYNYSNIFNNL